MQYQAKTQNGYNLMEAISALQKEIRRGNEEDAYYWALELTPLYEAYLWRRLVVIVNEDIGIANFPLLVLVPQQRAAYFEFRSTRNGNGSAKLILATTILALCRSPKSRIADEFNTVVEQERRHGKRIPIPDYALDKHTGRGRKMDRSYQHWLDEGCKLEPFADTPNPYIQRAREFWTGDFIRGDDWGKAGKSAQDDQSQPALFE